MKINSTQILIKVLSPILKKTWKYLIINNNILCNKNILKILISNKKVFQVLYKFFIIRKSLKQYKFMIRLKLKN